MIVAGTECSKGGSVTSVTGVTAKIVGVGSGRYSLIIYIIYILYNNKK